MSGGSIGGAAWIALAGTFIACGAPGTSADEAVGSAVSAVGRGRGHAHGQPAPNAPGSLVNLQPFPDGSGTFATYTNAPPTILDPTGPFFTSLGVNDRACVSCHDVANAWSITPASVQARFDASDGTDPIFRTNDGATSPNADVSTTEARRQAYSMLLSKGLIRVGLPIPQHAEFALDAVDDPYGFASATELSLFRRPLPSTNLKFLSTLMWDGRETFTSTLSTNCIASTSKCFASLHFDLEDQANAATQGHAQAPVPITSTQAQAIVAFETSLFTAQTVDSNAGQLDAKQGNGGPVFLASVPFYFGINDVLAGDYRTHAPFNPVVFTLFDAWAGGKGQGANAARAAVARGQALFNGKPIAITGVAGLNDDLKVAVINGTCTTCHDTPNAGPHSVPAPLNIGLTDAARRTPDMPLYTLRNLTTGAVVQTTDPGRALITGKWKDIGRFKGPILRGLAARAPYFHNGFAANLDEVVSFYDQRFKIGLTAAEKADLVAFLRSL